MVAVVILNPPRLGPQAVVIALRVMLLANCRLPQDIWRCHIFDPQGTAILSSRIRDMVFVLTNCLQVQGTVK